MSQEMILALFTSEQSMSAVANPPVHTNPKPQFTPKPRDMMKMEPLTNSAMIQNSSVDTTACDECGGDNSLIGGKITCCDCGHVKGAVAPVEPIEERPVPPNVQEEFSKPAVAMSSPAGETVSRPLTGTVEQAPAEPTPSPKTQARRK